MSGERGPFASFAADPIADVDPTNNGHRFAAHGF